jgi:hypothetical protein
MRKESKGAQIFCPVCDKATFVVRSPLYDGLRKVGEKLSCCECKTEFEDETKVRFVEQKKVEVFSEEDGLRLCMNCRHYVVNPFVQRCMVHKKEVEATDTCIVFAMRVTPKKEKNEEKKGSDALRRLFGEDEPEPEPKEE